MIVNRSGTEGEIRAFGDGWQPTVTKKRASLLKLNVKLLCHELAWLAIWWLPLAFLEKSRYSESGL